MPRAAAPAVATPRQTISSSRGEQFQIADQILKAGLGYPASFSGYTLTFTAKVHPTDSPPFLQKTSPASGITVTTNGSFTIQILGADTSALIEAAELVYDLELLEPDGTKTVVMYGSWRVALSEGS